ARRNNRVESIVLAHNLGVDLLDARAVAGLVKIKCRGFYPDEIHRAFRNGAVESENGDLEFLTRLSVPRQDDFVRSVPSLDYLPAALSEHRRQFAVHPYLGVVVDDDFKGDRRSGDREPRDLVRKRDIDAIPVEAHLSAGAARVQRRGIEHLPT